MKLTSIVKFFEHIAKREELYGVENGFRFKAVLSSRKKGSIHPAKYKTLNGDSDQEDQSRTTSNNHRQQRPRTTIPEGAQVFTGLMTPAGSQTNPSERSNTGLMANTGLMTPADSPAPRHPRTLEGSSQSTSSPRHSPAQDDPVEESNLTVQGASNTATQTRTPVADTINKQYETRSRFRSSNLHSNGGT